MKPVDEFTFPLLSQCQAPEHLFWKDVSRQTALKTAIFDVDLVHRTGPEGMEGDFVQIDAPKWVTVIPFFTGTDGVPRFVMERQYRHGSASVTLEFPAGIVEEGENPMDAALRELREETGLAASSCRQLGECNSNSAFMNNGANFFLAEGLEDSQVRRLDRNEQIDVVSVPVSEVLRNMGKGEMSNGVMLMSAFLFLQDRGFDTRGLL